MLSDFSSKLTVSPSRPPFHFRSFFFTATLSQPFYHRHRTLSVFEVQAPSIKRECFRTVRFIHELGHKIEKHSAIFVFLVTPQTRFSHIYLFYCVLRVIFFHRHRTKPMFPPVTAFIVATRLISLILPENLSAPVVFVFL